MKGEAITHHKRRPKIGYAATLLLAFTIAVTLFNIYMAVVSGTTLHIVLALITVGLLAHTLYDLRKNRE